MHCVTCFLYATAVRLSDALVPLRLQMASHELDMSMDPSLLIFGAAGNFLNAAKAGSSSSGGEISRGF